MHRLAARAGVEPWGYTLAELAWRADERAEAAWSHTAWLCWQVASMLNVSGQDLRLADFNPLELAKRAARQAAAERVRGKLPKSLSNAEIERRWAKYKAEMG